MPEVTPKPPVRRRAHILYRSLLAAVTRRPPAHTAPGTTAMRHSSELRAMVLALTLTEIPVAFLLSGILPPPARPFHALLEAALVLTGFGVLAALARNPHTVTASRVVLRTGFMGSLALPRTAVRSAALALRTIPGRGLRRVPAEPAAVACALGGTTSVRLRLDPPVPMDLGTGDAVTVDTVYVSADRPDAFVRALRERAESP
ncbi:hypothetical protein [Streptomyces sp. CB02414]|uniref:hypothetical protein n=1 Tax=Streptomyces sp. CB02414 TaxID=1703922 RepID=UPI00093A2912|nr:hypothetical protein [Streptomyces sp. CB02414]OKI86856.1 hypothetical protein AMK11_12055 [Streptomyces sp. CB02414]